MRRTVVRLSALVLVFAVLLAGCTAAPPLTPDTLDTLDGSPTTESIPTAENITPTQVPTNAESTPDHDMDPIQVSSSNTFTPITVNLRLSHAPILHEETIVSLTASTVEEAPDTTVSIILPSGAELIEGSTTWTGTLAPEQPHTIEARFQFVQEGNWIVEGKALSPQPGGDIWGDAVQIYLYVSSEEGHEGFEDAGGRTEGGQNAPTPPDTEPESNP